MNCGVTVAVFLAVTVSLVLSDPVRQRTEGRYQCSGYCKGRTKFRYVPGTTYVYNYTANTLTSVRGATKEKSRLHLTATANFHVMSECDFVLQLENVQLADFDLKNDEIHSSVARSAQFAAAVQKNSLHFSFQDGTVDELCPGDDPAWVLNIKRGILSAFQNTMHDLSSASEKRHETDISGTCETKYNVMLEEDEVNKPLLLIGKIKNLLACSHRMEHFLSLQSTPYTSPSGAQSLPLVKSQQRGNQVIGDGILWKATNSEIHTFRPFSKHDSGAVTMVHQMLVYRTSHSGGAPQAVDEVPKRHTTLLYERVDTTNDKMDREYTVMELLKELVLKTHHGVESDVPSVFSHLVAVLTSMNYNELEKVFNDATEKQTRKFLLDAMPFVSTADGITIMIRLFNSHEITSAQMDSWVTSLAFQTKPTLDILSSVLPLLNGSPSASAMLGTSALVHGYCQRNRNCQDIDQVREIMRKFEGFLGSGCQSSDQAKQQLFVLALKAIGNAGIFIESTDTLRKCIQAVNPIEVRLAAISAYRRLPCTESDQSHFLNLYTNKHEDTELRIAAYLAIMQCPSPHAIQYIKDTLYSEDVNQVASFVWTHLTNLQETSNVWKQRVRVLVSNDFLQNKFKTDVRKFSRNYEGSFFSESLNMGAAAESNVIFTPQSYLPRSAMLNLTLDLFGESVNILEFGARAEGFENIVENMFGPEGYFPDSAMNKILKKLKDKRESDSVENSISQLADQFNSKGKLEKEPSASVYTRVFGNEFYYTQLHGLKQMIHTIRDASSFNVVKKIMQQRDIDFTKSLVLIDGSYIIPTCVGFPLNLALNGSATVGLKLHGYANVKDLFTLNSFDIEGSVTPSAAIEFAGTMAVDATVTKAGIRLVNTLHTNTYISGKAKVQGGDLVDLQLRVPREKIELLDVVSQIFFLHHDNLVESKGIADNVENYTVCSTDIASSLIGMKPCMELTYVNSSLYPDAPYFPLTGPFRFHLDITKIDTFNAYEFIFKHQKEISASKRGTSMIFHFDTPGSKVDRKLSAQYVLDWTNAAAKASIMTPLIKVTASGKMENSDTLTSLHALIMLNNKELITTRIGCKRSKTGRTGRYEPFFALSYRKKLIADISGKMNYADDFKYSADFAIKGPSKEPITVSGNFIINENNYDVMGDIISKPLTSTIHGSLHFAENVLSAKAAVKYKIDKSQPHTLDFSAKLHESSRGTVIREGVYVTLQMSQFPHYNTDGFWEVQHSNHYFDSIFKLTVGNVTWQTQQLYHYQSTEDNMHLAILCTLACQKLGVDYGVDVLYQVANATISSHFKTTITPQYKLLGSLNYSHKLEDKMLQHELDTELSSPWYKIGIHGTLAEPSPSRHEIQLSSWWGTQTDVRRVNVSGFYLDDSNKLKVDHQLYITLTGELRGKLVAGLTSSSNLKNQWIKLEVYNKTYLANVTYIKDIFHFLEGTVQFDESVYGGSLVLLSTSIEKGFAVDLKVRKRLTLAAKVTCDDENHGLHFELFWDKDANPHKKISLVAEAVGNKKEVLLEIPGRYLKAEVVTVATEVTGFVEWEEHCNVTVQLEWNLDDAYADITAKLHTPFPWMRSLSLVGTYSLLENNGVLVVQTSWQEEKLNLTVNVRRLSTVSNLWGWNVEAHLESTVPAVAHVSFELEFKSCIDNHLSIQAFALLNYNSKQSTFEANWKSDKSSLLGDVQFNTQIQYLESVKYTVTFTDSSTETAGNLEIGWSLENKIVAEFVIKKVDAAGAFRITTPFIGYEITSAEYSFTDFQDGNGTTYVRTEANAVFREYVVMFDISGLKSNSSLGGILQLKTPFTDEFKIGVLHQLESGKLNETLLVSLAEEKLLFVYLVGEVQSFSNMRLSAGVQMPNQNMNVTIGNHLVPGSLQFNCGGNWNNNNINIIAAGSYENAENILSVHFDMTANSSLLQNVKLAFDHTSYSGTLQTSLDLPGDIRLTNTFIISDSLNWKNRLNFTTPRNRGSIENKQTFVDGVRLEHEIVANLTGQETSGLFTLVRDSQSFVIREAKAVVIVPWTDPIKILYKLPTDNSNIRPRLVIGFKHSQEIRFETDLQYQFGGSRLNMEIISSFCEPVVINASYSFEEGKWLGKILTQWGRKKASVECNLNYYSDMGRVSGEFFVRHSDLGGDIAGGSFGYNIIDPEITAHALGTYRDKKMGFGLSLILVKNVYKGSLTVQTPFQNWENLSLSGEVNMAKPTKLAVMTLSKNLEDITVSGLLSADLRSSNFSIALTSNICGFHSISVYGSYDVSNSNDHTIELACDSNGKIVEILGKLRFDNDSFLNPVMAEISLKTPFKGYEMLLAHYSCSTRGSEMNIDLQLIKSSWKFLIQSECSFNSGEGNGKVRIELPFDNLKELSISLRYGYRPNTLERTVSIVISRNQMAVEMAGTLLITEDGSLTAGVMIKTPKNGYRQLKCNVVLTSKNEQQKSITLTFSKDKEDYMVTGTFTLNTEAQLVIVTPLKGFENIESRIGYLRSGEEGVNSNITIKVYGYLAVPTGKSELNINLNLQEMNSFISAKIVSPLLMTPNVEIKGEYDLRMFPASLHFHVNINGDKFMSMQMILERSSLFGEIITPITGFTDVSLFGSFRMEEEKKQTNLKVKVGRHSFELLSTILFGVLASEIQSELLTSLPGIERITLHGQYDLLHKEKTAELTLTVDPSNIYELVMSGKADSMTGHTEFRMYTPVPEFKSLCFVAKYDLTRDYNVDLLVERNGKQNNFGCHVTFTDDGTLIRFETPFSHAEDILLYLTYQTGNNGKSANLTVVRNGHWTILDSSFKFKNNIAVINISTPYESVRELIITVDLSAVSVDSKESSLAISVFRNSQHLWKASSHIFIDWGKEINAQFELSSPLLSNSSNNLSCKLHFIPVFPPPKIQFVVMKNAITAVDFRSDFNAKFWGFTYDLMLTTQHGKQFSSIYFSPGEKFVRFNIDLKTADTLEQYIGDLRINKATGTLSAIFTSPIVGYEKFSFQWKQGYDFVDGELITPFKGYENHTIAAHFDVRDINKSAKFHFGRNNDVIDFRTSVERTDNTDILNLHIVTPFIMFKKFDLRTQCMKIETKHTIDLNVTANNQQLETCGELFSEGDAFEAKLDVTSSLQDLEKINANFFYNITESAALEGKLNIGNMSANIAGTIDFDFLWGELSATMKKSGQITEHRIKWRLENTSTKTAKIIVSHGYELNFVIDAILNISSLKNVQAQVSYIKPTQVNQLYPYTSTYKLQWNVRNIMSLNGGLFLMLHNVPICNLNFNVDFGNTTETNTLSADYFGFFNNYKIHITYQVMNNSGIELTSEINLAGTEILTSLNFMPYKSKFTTKCGEVHFILSYDTGPEFKALDFEYQVSHYLYSLSSNLTFHKFNLPLMSFTLKTPIRHYSFLHASNQYSFNTTHKGFKILLQKEDRSGEISFSVWNIRNNVGLEGNMSLPVEYLVSWYGIANLDMTSGIAGNVYCSWNSTEYLTVNFKYAPNALKANINTTFTGLETINIEFLLLRKNIMAVLFSVDWGEKRFLLNGTAGFSNGSRPEFIILFHSPWTDPFTLLGKYDNKETSAVSVILQMGTKVTKLEGQLKYFIKDLKFDMDFLSEFNGYQVTAKAGYDFEYPTKWTYLEARFLSLNLLINGSLSSGGMEGRLFVKTPFHFFQGIAADGKLTFGQAATFKLIWNDEVYILHGEYKRKLGQVNCQFTVVTPYIEFEDIRLNIRYDHKSANVKLQSPSEILYLDCSYHFQAYAYSIGATLKVPSVTLLKHLYFTVSVDAANLTTSAIGQWSASQAVNISASFLPTNQFIKVETPFEGFEKIVASGSLKVEDTHLVVVGMLKVGSDNVVYVHHITGEGFMQHSLIINIPTYYKMNFNVTVQFYDPRNMYTKLTFGGISTENAFSAEGMLNVKDMYLKLSVHHPLLEGSLTCKTLLKVNASLQIRTTSFTYKMEGSYVLSRNEIAIKWSAQTPGFVFSTLLGGSYQYDRSELKTKLYFNEDLLTSCYKINKTSLAANFKLNSSALLKIKDFTLDIEGSHSPNLYGLVSYKYNKSSAGVAIFLSKTEETAVAQVTVYVQPLLGYVNHTVQITFNVKDPQNFFVCEYDGKTIHKIWMSYENNGTIFKVTADTSSSILGTQRALLFIKRNWEMAHLEVMDVFIVTLKAKRNEGYLVISACGMEHEAFYHFTFENGFLGTLDFESPLISSGKVNVTAAVRSEIKNMSVDLKWITGVDAYHATLQLNSTEERTAIKAEIIALLETILSLNAYIVMNSYTVQAETSLNFLGTVSKLQLRHKRELPLDTELNIMTPSLPKKIIRFILNTDNSSLILYGSHGDESYGEYIVLEGTINHNESLAFLNFKAPKLPLVQYIGIRGIARLGDEGRYDLGLSIQFSSEKLQSEFSAKFCFSATGIDTFIEFLPPWKDGERYGATILIPFMLSNSMSPEISINFGNNTYSLHGKFINLNDVKQLGFGAQYKLRKLGGELKIENAPIPGMQVEVDVPLGDSTGHYVVNIKGHKGKNLLDIENMLNYTLIDVEWNGKQVEVRYSLSYTGADGNNVLDVDKNLQCTFVLELKTPFYSYEKSGLKMYVSLSSSQYMITTTINYPGNSKPFGFEFNYQLKSYNDITLVSQLHIPFISALEDVALVLSNKIEEKHGTFKSALGGHWNKEELAITLDGSSKEETVFKGTVTLKLIGQTYALEANYGSPKRDMLGPYVLRAWLTSPFEVLNNAEAYMEINLMKSVLASITQNSKELFCFHIYSDEVTLLGLQMRSAWRSAYFVGSYDMEKDIMIHAELSWESNPLNRLEFGIIFALSYGPGDRREMSASLKLPSRVLMFNLTNQVSQVYTEHACSFSWKKDQIIGFKTIFNVTNSSDNAAVSAVGHIDLPHRSFELGSYASARFMDDTMKYIDIGTEFLWDALEDRNKKIGIAFRQYSTGLEIILQHILMRNDLVIRIVKHGKLLYDHLPFTVRIEVEYSALPEELIIIDAYVQYPKNTPVGINVGFSLCHIPTSIDLKIAVEIAQTTKESTGRLSVEHLNSYTGQKHRIEVMGKMNMLQPEMKLAMRTAENQLEVHGLLKTGSSGHYGALVELLMSQKKPLSVEASVHLAEARIELEARYGNSRSYKIYAAVPHCREIAMGIKHVFYETEYEDIGIMLRLNTSQQLWSRIKWQPQALTELKTGFLQEYSDIIYVVQSISSGYSEALMKDFAYKCNIVYPVLVDMVDRTVSAFVTELSEIYKDFLDMVEEVRNMYRRNDFYLQDILPYVSNFVSYVTGKASGVCRLLLDGMEIMYLTVKNFIVTTVNTFQNDFSHIFNILYDIKVVASKTGMYVVNFTDKVKRLHSVSKEYLKSKLEAARLGIMQAEENMKHLLTYIENYLADLLTSYIHFLEPYLTSIENTMELLGRIVIDFEDKISEYIFDMVDTVLGAEEVKELAAVYSKYSSWLEELHLQDYIDQATKFFESISKLVMQDIHRVLSDYFEYLDNITDAMENMYRNINAMPLVAYTKHAMNIIEEKAKWLWKYYNLSDNIKMQVHSWIENLDKILLRLLNAIDMDVRSPTKSFTPSIKLHPDIGLIEYSQKLPIEWNGFNELPKFEQLHLYEQAKEHTNEIASLDKYRYYLMDTFYDITSNISLVSVLPPFSAYGMVIGKYHYITFDKKFYSFTGAQECSYLLANDFLTSKFSVYVTYKTENREIVKKSLTVLIEGHHIVISSNKQVTIDGQRVELPVAVGIETWIKRNGERVVVHSELGIEVECNLHYDICAIELSGWFFGKTGGMLGTFDYEPSNDLSFPNGTVAHTIEAFADSWRVGSARFQSVTYPAIHTYPPIFEELQASDRNPCTVYFGDQASPLRHCFSHIGTDPFYEMCLSEHPSSTGVCTSVAAYVSQCRRTNVDIWMPQTCVHCQTQNGSTMNVSELEVHDGVESMLADVVFVVEQSPCIKKANLAKLVSKLDASLKLQGLNTRFSVVVFNGRKFSEPYTHTSSGKTWATVQGTEKALRSLQSGISNSSSPGNQSTFSALWHASRLPFRATASKTIVLLQCKLCQETEDEYSNMISMLLENDITLHMLQPLTLKMHSGQGKTNKVYGVDLHGAFSGRNLKSLTPSLPLLRQIKLPKDMCTPLALETNGTLFNLHHLQYNVSGTHRHTVKKFIDVWARRVTLTAKPYPCQKCRCVANQDGVGQIMCSKCLSPSTDHFLKEWGNLNTDIKRTWARPPDDI